MSCSPAIVVLGAAAVQVSRVKQAAEGIGSPLQYFSLDVDLPAELLVGEPVLIVITAGFFVPAALERLPALRADFPAANLVIVAAEASQQDIIQAHRQGVNDFLLEPFSDAELEQALRRWYRPVSNNRLADFLRRLWGGFSERASRSKAGALQPRPGIIAWLPGGMPELSSPEALPAADLKVRFFGSFALEYRGELLPITYGQKIVSLLAYLLYHYQRPLHREVLMAKFWGDFTSDSARNSLNVAIFKIRQLFKSITPKEEVLRHDHGTYQIEPRLALVSDVEAFMADWKKGRATEYAQGLEAALPYYHRAVALYQGDFLEAILQEEWCESERDSLIETYLFILNRLSDYFFQHQSYLASTNVCHKILEKDSCLEETHQRLIVCYQHLGMRDKAIRQYYLCEEALRKELAVRPSAHTRQLFEALSRGDDRFTGAIF
jgi:DNA-binding SARP family transcriptional activator/CheY-like chemotaxis protein